jgi:ribose transport system ATP-binding protein
MNSTAPSPLLMMKGMTKRFPGVLALDSVDLDLYDGEILGLIGENGAGKSTLMRILGGDYPADGGEIFFSGTRAEIADVQHSIALGVSVIYQELNLAPNLDIASNMFLGREPRKGVLGIVDTKKLYARAEELARRVGISAGMTTLVEKLSPGEQQLVEIAKALSVDSRILVLDEPTSSLSPTEAGKLFEVMRALKQAGVSMIYISHRLAEVQEMCDRVIVLRDGELAGEIDRSRHAQLGLASTEEMVRLMVGRDISRFFPEHGEEHQAETVLSVREFTYAAGKGAVNFELRSGEILGIAGLVGAGRTELVQALFGIEPKTGGEVFVRGAKVDIRHPADAILAGMGLVPEDRKALGVILEMPVVENISLSSIGTYNPPFLDRARETQVATELVDKLEIKTPSLAQFVQFLSGGNQQKVALAKWLATNPRILILDEPTRGIDVGSKSEIYKLIRALADDGMGVIMVSSEMEEVMGLSDRVLVMHEGRCTGILDRHEISEENIMHLATGVV